MNDTTLLWDLSQIIALIALYLIILLWLINGKSPYEELEPLKPEDVKPPEADCPECDKQPEGLRPAKCRRCDDLRRILETDGPVNRNCAECGGVFISRYEVKECRPCRKPMTTEPRPMIDRVRDSNV